MSRANKAITRGKRNRTKVRRQNIGASAIKTVRTYQNRSLCYPCYFSVLLQRPGPHKRRELQRYYTFAVPTVRWMNSVRRERAARKSRDRRGSSLFFVDCVVERSQKYCPLLYQDGSSGVSLRKEMGHQSVSCLFLEDATLTRVRGFFRIPKSMETLHVRARSLSSSRIA